MLHAQRHSTCFGLLLSFACSPLLHVRHGDGPWSRPALLISECRSTDEGGVHEGADCTREIDALSI